MFSILISSESRYPVSRPKIKEKVAKIVKNYNLTEAEVSISVVGNRKIRELNRRYRDLDQATDVLSFPLEEPRGPDGILRLGDIVISYPAAQDWAKKRNKLVEEIILELVEHGLLHLLGFNHDNGAEFKIPTTKNFPA